MSKSERVKIGIVGASTMLGRELIEGIADSIFAVASLVLLDEEDAAGKVTAAGDEPAFVQLLNADAFTGLNLVFFAGAQELTRKHWKDAIQAGAAVIDMSYALVGEPGVPLHSPWVSQAQQLGASTKDGPTKSGPAAGLSLETSAVVSAHPAAWMLALIAARLAAKLPLVQIAATVFKPASEQGRAGMDELHEQTVSLLSFKPLPKSHYDAQITFNLIPELGADAKISLASIEARIADHYRALGTADDLPPLALQLIQAPVFHSYTSSILLEFAGASEDAADLSLQISSALGGSPISVVADPTQQTDPAAAPSNVTAAGQGEILIRVRPAGAQRAWLWMAADNLKLNVINALACASDLRHLRPSSKVQ